MKEKASIDREALNGTKSNETVGAQYQHLYDEIQRMKQQ